MRAPFSHFLVKPALTALGPDNLGDPVGGDTVVLTGRNFGPFDVPKFGGVASPSFVRNSPVQFTAVTPAHAVGNVGVTVEGPAGISNALPFEYYDPSVLGPTLFLDRVLADGSPAYVRDATYGTWTRRAGSIGATLVRRVIASAPADGGGYPVFSRAGSNLLAPAITTITILEVWGMGDMSIAAGVNLTSIEVQGVHGGADDASNATIFGNDNGYGSLLVGGPAANRAIFHYHSGANKTADLVLAGPLGRAVIGAKKVDVAPGDAEMRITQNGALWVTGSTHVGALTGGSLGQMFCGFTGYYPYYLDGAETFIVTGNRAWSDAEFAKLYRWAAIRHP